MICSQDFIEKIASTIAQTPQALFAVLIGSRATGKPRPDSDWDIAILWQQSPALERIARHETLRRHLAKALSVPENQIDLVDLANARLAMRALVAEEGRLLRANDELAWAKFLVRTWRELEEVHWETSHAV